MAAFRLAGILRLRHAQQEKAAAVLADANERMREAADARFRARRTLEDAPTTEIVDAATMSAVAAARASTRGMLEELTAAVEVRANVVAEAQAAYNAARRTALGLEKLEAAHVLRTAAEELRAEQIVLDEIAGRGAAAVPPVSDGGAR